MSERTMRRTRVKMCGMMDATDIAMAVAAGADAIGVITAPSSPRCVSAEVAEALIAVVPPFVTPVGVMTNPTDDEVMSLWSDGYMLQFSGEELPPFCHLHSLGRRYIKAFHLRDGLEYEKADFEELAAYKRAHWMFDSRVGERLGGTGVPFHWQLVRPVAAVRPIIVSGGLTPDNVADCVRLVRPFAVDVRSGIETDGKKDYEKMHAFVRAVREADGSD